MTVYIVTVKLQANKEHDPKNKQQGFCPLDDLHYCSDKTGQHHSFLIVADSDEHVRQILQEQEYHVTRIESA